MCAALPAEVGEDSMTDARYPDRWLTDARILLLSDRAHRLFVTGLAWSVSNRSDGLLTPNHLMLMQRVDTSAAGELVAAGLWAADGDNYRITVFEQTQTSAAQLAGLETKKRNDADRQADKRRRDASLRGVTRDTKDKQGQDRTARRGREGGDPSAVPSQRARVLSDDSYDR